MSLSACLIAHNEAAALGRTLDSLTWADEVVVVDCESTDDTARIARERGCTVLRRPNESNLNVNKNVSFDAAGSDWILCIDADEVVPPALAAEIRTVVEQGGEHAAYFLRRRNNFLGRFLRHGGSFPDKQLRLFRRGAGRFQERHVHERITIDGSVGILTEPFEHYPYPTVSSMVQKMDFYTTFEAEHLYARGVRFSSFRFVRAVFSADLRFVRRYLFKLGFLDGAPGFAAALMDYCARIMSELKLRERGLAPRESE